MMPATELERVNSESNSLSRGIGSIKKVPSDVSRQVEYSSALTAESYSCQVAIFDAIRSKSRAGRTASPSFLGIDREMFVLEMLRHAFGLLHFNFFRSGVERVVRFAAFRCATHVSGRVGERNARFGHADKFHGLLRCNRQRQRFRIS